MLRKLPENVSAGYFANMTVSHHSSKADWLLARDANRLTPDERARKLKLRIIVASIVAACAALTLIGGVLNLIGH